MRSLSFALENQWRFSSDLKAAVSWKMGLREALILEKISLPNVFSFVNCRSFRSLEWNELSGTIPPELGNLTQLRSLYAQNRIVLFKFVNTDEFGPSILKLILLDHCMFSFVPLLKGLIQ